MKESLYYTAIYEDDLGASTIVIENDFKNLSLEIDGVKFIGSEFSDLVILDKEKYTPSQIARFTLFSTPIYGTKIVQETLCNCSFTVIVPQNLINHQTNSPFNLDLTIECLLGKERSKPQGGVELEQVKLSLTINGKLFEGTGDFFEIALDTIHKQFDNQYSFKNCYGCMYSDYSIYGQSNFGTMHCYVGQKENYLNVKDKSDYVALSPDFEIVQEIYSCEQYEIRKNNTGYRG